MKKWKIATYVAGILCIVVILQVIVNRLFINDKRIMEAFVKCNTNVYESSLNVVAEYGQKVMSMKQKRQYLSSLAENVGILDGYSLTDNSSTDSDTLYLEKKGINMDTTFELVSVMPQESEDKKIANHYLVINISVNNNFENILSYKDKLEKSLEKDGISNFQSSVILRGCMDGKLTDYQKMKKVKGMLASLQAKEVNIIKTDNLYTVYAYTGLVHNYINVSGYRININVAISYDEIKNQTEIYLATPILNESY